MKIVIVIPARYASTRFPGKPLVKIGGKSMLARVVDVAQKAARDIPDVSILVATEDQRIADHAKEIGAQCALTSEECRTGSDRALEAIKSLDDKPDFVLNLQGDAPFTPISVVRTMLEAMTPDIEVITPACQLNWEDLDRLRDIKKMVPFSGTTVVTDNNGRALWFSKNIIPAIRKEETLRQKNTLSPICQHMGLYGFRADILEKFCNLPQSPYELLEGLEQLRMLENGIQIKTIMVDIDKGLIQTGIDTPEDAKRAEELLKASA